MSLNHVPLWVLLLFSVKSKVGYELHSVAKNTRPQFRKVTKFVSYPSLFKQKHLMMQLPCSVSFTGLYITVHYRSHKLVLGCHSCEFN